MAERRTIGQILLGLGRITEDQMAQALEHQRDHGGYFGEALLACGFVRREELEWGLATQFDLPYVFPEADAIDPEAAALVSPEWALAHLTLPIMRTAEGLTVVVESPTKTQAVDELQARVDLPIQLALTSAATIRSLIREVYAGGGATDDLRAEAVDLEEALTAALQVGADRFGISTRGATSWVWWDHAGTVHRRVLHGLWESELEELLVPPPREQVEGHGRATWKGQMRRAGTVTPVQVRYLADAAGREYVFRPVRERALLQERFPLPSPGLMSEIRLLARSGSARFLVTAEPAELGHEVLPHLPLLVLDPAWRSVHLHVGDRDPRDRVFGLEMPRDTERWAEELELLRDFHFDVVTADLGGREEAWARSALDVAGVVFLRWPDDEERRPAYEAGIRWELHVAREEGGHLAWTLQPLEI